MLRWAWRGGTAFGVATAVVVIKLMVHDTLVPAIWAPVNVGIMLGGMLGSLYGIRAQMVPGHVFDIWRDIILNVAIGVVGGMLVGSMVAVIASIGRADLPEPLFGELGPIVMVWTVIGTIVGFVAGAIIDRVWARPRDG